MIFPNLALTFLILTEKGLTVFISLLIRTYIHLATRLITCGFQCKLSSAPIISVFLCPAQGNTQNVQYLIFLIDTANRDFSGPTLICVPSSTLVFLCNSQKVRYETFLITPIEACSTHNWVKQTLDPSDNSHSFGTEIINW